MMSNATIKDLRDRWTQCINTGDFSLLDSESMKILADNMKQAYEALILFPECRSTKVWLIHEECRLRDIIKARKSV